MKRLFSYFISIGIVILLALSEPAAEAKGGCNLQGSWISFDDSGIPTWISSSQGQSAMSGTSVLEYPAEFPTLPTPDGPMFPNAAGMTQLRGAWERTGGNTFDYTFVGYGFDANGVPLWLGRLSGDITLSNDCNTLVVTATLYVFPCAVNCSDPYGDAEGIPIPPSTAYRVRVE